MAYLPVFLPASVVVDVEVLVIRVLGLKKECQYHLAGDLNDDCKVGFYDFSLMAANWLIDCDTDPNNPACISK